MLRVDRVGRKWPPGTMAHPVVAPWFLKGRIYVDARCSRGMEALHLSPWLGVRSCLETSTTQ